MTRYGYLPAPKPKNGILYKVLVVERISTIHQDERSLDDQGAFSKRWLDQNLDGPYEVEVISSRGSGERLDRIELENLCDRIESGTLDLVIAEDLARICRRSFVIGILEAAEDSGTRVIAINDSVDTNEENWRFHAGFASMKHESYNVDTSKRIQRSLRNRFQTGQMVHTLPAGYIKPLLIPPLKATEADCSKDPSAEPIYDETFTRLEEGQTFSQIADWWNEILFPVGPGSRQKKWTGRKVAQTVYNPILKGLREHNHRVAKRVNKTGRRKCVDAPDDMLLQREAPHLAFIEPERYDRVIAMLRERNAPYRKGIAAANPGGVRKRGTRNDSQWPSQHVRCGVCGRNFVLGGHGDKHRLMCDGVRDYKCFNALTVDRVELATKSAAIVADTLINLPDFEPGLFKAIESELDVDAQNRDREIKRLELDRSKFRDQIKNLVDAIAIGGEIASLLGKLNSSESELRIIDAKIAQFSQRQVSSSATIPSAEVIRGLARQIFGEIAIDSREFGDLMRRLLKNFFIVPFRLIDGGHIEARVRFDIDLAELNGVNFPSGLPSMTIPCTVDLTKSPQRVTYREAVMRLRSEGMTERQTASKLGITHTAAQDAARLDRIMAKAGIADPWMQVISVEQCLESFKRLRHPRFNFEPLPGFEQIILR